MMTLHLIFIGLMADGVKNILIFLFCFDNDVTCLHISMIDFQMTYDSIYYPKKEFTTTDPNKVAAAFGCLDCRAEPGFGSYVCLTHDTNNKQYSLYDISATPSVSVRAQYFSLI